MGTRPFCRGRIVLLLRAASNDPRPPVVVQEDAALRAAPDARVPLVGQPSGRRLSRSRSNATASVDGIDDWVKRINSRGSLVQVGLPALVCNEWLADGLPSFVQLVY